MANRNNSGGRGNSGRNNNGGGDQRKASGAGHTVYQPKSGPNAGNNQYLTHGWRKQKNGGDFIAVKCLTTSKSKVTDKGWMGHIACTFTNQQTGETNFHWGCMQKSTGKVVISSLMVVVNPKAPNGGYCGTFKK